MRIAVVAPVRASTSGLADYGRELAAALGQAGHEVTGPDDAEVVIFNHAPFAQGVRTGWLRAVADVRRLPPGADVIVVFHEVYERGDDRLRTRIFERAQRWSFRKLAVRATATVVADDPRARRLESLLRDASRPEIVPVGPNLPVPPDPPTRASEPVVLAFGLLQRFRAYETLVRAAAAAARARPGLRLVLAGDMSGDPARLAAIRELAAETGAPLELTGKLPAAEVAARFAAARAFVSPYTDAVSLGSGTLAAAFAYGLPVVVLAGTELHPRLVPGETVVEGGRGADDLARAILFALTPAADAIARAGREIYERELSWERIAARFAELIATRLPGR